MTLVDQIMGLNNGTRTVRQIATIVYGEVTDSRLAYVRVVLNQRKGGTQSAADVKYRTKPGMRERANARSRVWRKIKLQDPQWVAHRAEQQRIRRSTEEGRAKYNAWRRDYFKRRYHSDPQWRAKCIAKSAAHQTARYRTDPVYREHRRALKRAWDERRRQRMEASPQ